MSEAGLIEPPPRLHVVLYRPEIAASPSASSTTGDRSSGSSASTRA